MKISTTTGLINKFYDDFQCIDIIKNAGFDAYDFNMSGRAAVPHFMSDSYIEHAYKLREYADKSGIICNQTHAPYPTMLLDDKEYSDKIFNHIVRALQVTHILGGTMCVVHPCNNADAATNAEKLYLPLLPYAKKYNVKVGVENMWNHGEPNGKKTPAACSSAQSFTSHLKLLDEDYFVACLDIGHAAIMNDDTTPEKLIHALKDRLYALHVHDNDLYGDQHILPFNGKINWKSVFHALYETNYKGYLTFEVECFGDDYPYNLVPEYVKYLYKVGKELSDLFR